VSRTTFRFLQVSDVHLGRLFTWLPPERRVERRLELREVWRRTIDEAIRRRVDALLVPGDLFDGEEADPETVNRAVECVRTSGCPPVYIAPGNHDCYSKANTYYDNDKLAARGQVPWPEHVHIFKSKEFSSVRHPKHTEVEIWGRSVHANVDCEERVLRDLPARDPKRLHLALLHGSREGFRRPGKRITAPFSDDELLGAGFEYVALGHYHEPAEMRDPAGVLRAAYAGSAAALDRDETGEHGALDVRIVRHNGRVREIAAERVAVDPRRLLEVKVDLTGVGSPEGGRERIVSALAAAKAGAADLVVCRLEGRPLPGVSVVPGGEAFAGTVWYLHLDASRLRPAYDLTALRGTGEPRTSEERFVRSFVAEMEAEADPERKARLEAALYYGLDALRQAQVAPRYEWGIE
jgi:hypothetical protein